MKKLTDISIFRRHPLRFLREKEGCSYFARNNFEWQSSTFLPQKPPDALFWCASIWESKMKSGCHMRRVNSNFLALEHVQKGSLCVRQNETMFLAEEDDFFLLRPGGELEFMTGPQGFCVKESLILSGNLLDDMLKRTGLEDKNYLPNVNVKKFETLLHSFKTLAKEFHSGILQELEHRAYDLILLLKEPPPSEKMSSELVELLAFMETNLAYPFSLKELARHCGCSVSHLTRLFHLHYHTTPYKLLVDMRMRRAASLLLETDFSIKEIASKVGYDSALNFSTEFKKKHRLPPRVFRRKYLSL